METLLRLSEVGHYEAVLKLFAFPVKNCPDVLLLALLQVNVNILSIYPILYDNCDSLFCTVPVFIRVIPMGKVYSKT